MCQYILMVEVIGEFVADILHMALTLKLYMYNIR